MYFDKQIDKINHVLENPNSGVKTSGWLQWFI